MASAPVYIPVDNYPTSSLGLTKYITHSVVWLAPADKAVAAIFAIDTSKQYFDFNNITFLFVLYEVLAVGSSSSPNIGIKAKFHPSSTVYPQ